MSDYFLCCFYYNRQSDSRGASSKFPLRNIDKSMIGLPTNFQHCAHIGCSDLSTGSISVSGNVANSSVTGLMQPNIHRVHNQHNQYMHHQQPILAHMKLIDLKSS